MPRTKDDPVAFFYANAGYSYDPREDTPEEGRHRCAQALAYAEQWARDNDATFWWARDDDAEMMDGYDRALWRCDAIIDGELRASLGGIDIGEGSPYPYGCGCLGEPTSRTRDPYCRVVEAELASEVMGDTL